MKKFLLNCVIISILLFLIYYLFLKDDVTQNTEVIEVDNEDDYFKDEDIENEE